MLVHALSCVSIATGGMVSPFLAVAPHESRKYLEGAGEGV